MKIRYSKRQFLFNGLLGGTFLITGLLQLYRKTEIYQYLIYGAQILLGLLMVVSYFYEKKLQYITIEKGTLTRNRFFFSRSLQLNKISKVQSFPGKIKLFTSEEKITINTELIEDESRNDLLRVLGSLEVENNPFIGYSTKTS